MWGAWPPRQPLCCPGLRSAGWGGGVAGPAAGFGGRGLGWVGRAVGGVLCKKLPTPSFGGQDPVIFNRESAQLCRWGRPPPASRRCVVSDWAVCRFPRVTGRGLSGAVRGVCRVSRRPWNFFPLCAWSKPPPSWLVTGVTLLGHKLKVTILKGGLLQDYEMHADRSEKTFWTGCLPFVSSTSVSCGKQWRMPYSFYFHTEFAFGVVHWPARVVCQVYASLKYILTS